MAIIGTKVEDYAGYDMFVPLGELGGVIIYRVFFQRLQSRENGIRHG